MNQISLRGKLKFKLCVSKNFLIDLTLIFVVYLVKPKEFAIEELDPSDPDSMYFVYICKKTPDLVLKKKIKLGRLTKKQIKATKRKPFRANVKPAGE